MFTAGRGFRSAPEAAGEARQWVSEALTSEAPGVDDIVVLVVSELVTNAVVHGAGTVSVELECSAHAVRVAVGDHGSATVLAQDAAREASCGRGLGIVDTLTSAWGVEASAEGTTVWAYVPV